ncbi:FAD protein [Coleophoma cylindrospora]|uniref:FAD protein n=1 Tax=Coleophoma cylindrospora TaxID=1849047 RepID=A0A3D8QS30_9HELO|nr:FAD protein [Coleophoma cylindrospora]
MCSYRQEDKSSAFAPPNKIGNVAIIGAGISGIVTAVHLLRAGIEITVFERADGVGGAWDYSPEPDRDPTFPSTRPPTPDWADLENLQAKRLTLEEAASLFAPPGPVYANMKSRNSNVVMRTSLMEWPQGIREPMDHSVVLAYIRSLARDHHVQDKIHFRTRVEAVSKAEGDNRWYVRTGTLVSTSTSYMLEKKAWEFDAIVVATGRYSIPRIPDVPGLSAWKYMFPARISHSKQYRTPTLYRGKTVLIIGAFISAMEITSELVNNGAKVYESANNTRVDFRDHVQHENAEKVAMVAEFSTLPADNQDEANSGSKPLDDNSPIPGKVILTDGQVLENIHQVIIATGYLTTFPFLGPLLEQPFTQLQDAGDEVITTADGRTVHNLHEDIFYIPDPTLAFIGITHFASTFSLYDFQAQVLAVVFAGQVRLPSEAAMKAEQWRRKRRVLPGTLLNSIFMLDDFVIRRLLDWVNQDLVASGLEPLSGPDPEWWKAFKLAREKARPLLGMLQDNYLGT